MQLPSPLDIVNFNQITLSIKRDDLIDPFVSGNKWRKLKYILSAAKEEKKNHIVTFGGAYSNHLVATAAAAAKNNFTATAFVRGENVSNEMLMMCKLYGMRLIFIDRERYKDKKTLFNQHFGTNQNAYFVDEGGACYEATLGCAEIIDELPFTFDHILVAAGTGTTAAGLLKGINAQNLATKLHVIPVLKGGDFIRTEIEKYVSDTSKLHLHTEYHFGGYAKTTPELINFLTNFTSATGVLLDPVYTAKLAYAAIDLIKHGNIKNNSKILIIHSGGLFGLLGMKEKIHSFLDT